MTLPPPSRFFRQFRSRSITQFGWFTICNAPFTSHEDSWLAFGSDSCFGLPPGQRAKWGLAYMTRNLPNKMVKFVEGNLVQFWQEFWGWIKYDCPLTFGKRLFCWVPNSTHGIGEFASNFLQAHCNFFSKPTSSIFNIISSKRFMIFYFYINELSKCLAFPKPSIQPYTCFYFHIIFHPFLPSDQRIKLPNKMWSPWKTSNDSPPTVER